MQLRGFEVDTEEWMHPVRPSFQARAHAPLFPLHTHDHNTNTAFVRAVDWVDTVWPPEKKVQGDYPKVIY